VLTVHEQVGVQEAGVHDRRAGQEASVLPRGVDLGGHRAIGCRAGGGALCVLRCGRSSSQVSVRCP
jgi:hypothetical protein